VVLRFGEGEPSFGLRSLLARLRREGGRERGGRGKEGREGGRPGFARLLLP